MSKHAATPQHERVHFLSAGTLLLITVMVVGYGFGLVRMINGIGSVTNLNDQYPWGIWIAIDVACGVALAAGGFTTAALVNIFGDRRFHALERPALLTAWLGYTFVGAGLLFDLGRYYNIWHPAIYWQGNSVLFEVGMCVMFYLTVLTVEFAPALLAGLMQHMERGYWWTRPLMRFERALRTMRLWIRRILPIFIIAGVVLSFMHQSSLGTLMLIAPSKVSPLWFTPIMPVLFLLSAIMVGFPVVIFEAIFAAKAYKKAPEMHLLTPLAGLVRYTLGAYALVKFGDFFYRNDLSVFTINATDTIAFLIEIGVGIIVPFVLLMQSTVRRSPRWLFITVSMIIVGLVLNRINVFLTGYHPAHGGAGYFPAIGEVAVTGALVATIIFLYRFFAHYFPVLPAGENEEDPIEREIEIQAQQKTRLGGWVMRALAVLVLLAFIDIYSYVHGKAVTETQTAFKKLSFKVSPTALKKRPFKGPLSFSSEAMPALLTLTHPVANQRTDDFLPVRFTHREHALHVGGDCSKCHHRAQRAGKKNDRVGVAIDRGKLASFRPSSCVACHQRAAEDDHPLRPGLKGAYHQQCIDCHRSSRNANAPLACAGACHRRRVPNHKNLVKLEGKPSAHEVTARCLECHRKQGDDILRTAHWTWRGPSPHAAGLSHRVDLGKANLGNGFCIHVASNEQRCSQCHVGYGWKDASFDFKDAKNIDCLVCHDTTGTYAKGKKSGGMPEPSVDLAKVAANVGHPTRKACGSCHFYGGGGVNVKHGDLEPALVKPKASFDVHMGRSNMVCQDCHKTHRHRIAGQSAAIPASEGRIHCSDCHAKRPHRRSKLLGLHLDKHLDTLSCQSCHVPLFARVAPTKMSWDWSKAGKEQPKKKDEHGMPTFAKKKGAFTWAKNVRPVYRWYNGDISRHLVGQKLAAEGETVLNSPVGSIKDPTARISPFKLYRAVVPIDAESRKLAVPKLFGGFWKHFDWTRAVKDGMKAAKQPFSGKVGFAPTRMYWAINHGVVPAKKALRCADCHQEQDVACRRCHGPKADFHPTDSGPCRQCHGRSEKKWVDFTALGYKGDPARVGGRGRLLPLPGAYATDAGKKKGEKKDPKKASDEKPKLPEQYEDGLYDEED